MKSAQPGVFTRLHTLFSPSLPFLQSSAVSTSPLDARTPLLPSPRPQFVKVRIVTWNMHDSLPKGNLEDLLGAIPLHTPRDQLDEVDKLRIPDLSMEEGHPYHIIVVAGQECPHSSVHLGLAANFKHKDAKDREKEERHGEKDVEKDVGKDKDILHQTKQKISKHLKHEHTLQTRSQDSPDTDSPSDMPSHHNFIPTSGWSAVLEDWFANGVGILRDVKPVVAGTPQSPAVLVTSPPSSLGYQIPERPDVDWNPNYVSAADSSSSTISNIKAKRGSYELLAKERLMGIYTAVYVHRDVRSLVRGFSTGAVPAGLIGGRLGNKGGVGISINLHGTTMLFINAHLAAHEDKAPLRIANLAKIKTELPLESWLAADDPRALAEDITDRFDHSWIFGDLNFRLDVSRLHADWLISREEYSQAFEFDQLHKLMESGDGAFAGFIEAKIEFPPTFKYDVMRTLKHKSHRRHKHFKDNPEEDDLISEGAGDEEEYDVISVHSTALASTHSRDSANPAEVGDDSDHTPPSNSPGNVGITRSSSPGLVSRVAVKAKTKWAALLDSSRGVGPTTDLTRRQSLAAPARSPGSSIELSQETRLSSPGLSLRRVVSANTRLGRNVREENHESPANEKGVYDSSSKQRVPSWCDRILWKTTVEPPEDQPGSELMIDQAVQTTQSGGQFGRVGQLILQGFRSQARRDSISTELPSDHAKSEDRSGNPFYFILSPFSKSRQPVYVTSSSTSPDLYQSKSLQPSPTFLGGTPLASRKELGLDHPASAPATRDRTFRRQSLPVYSHPRPPTPRRADSDQIYSASSDNSVTPTTRIASKRWFSNLLSRDRSPSSNKAQTQPAPPPAHRKGDVLCLSYHTLDDKQMRRLEGRSDHRPVIGSFAIHI